MTVLPVNGGVNLPVSGSVEQPDKGKSFGDFLRDAVSQVNTLQAESDTAGEKLAAGEITDIHQVMIAGEKAYLALQLTIQVRNKILDAYHEVMRMQV